VSQRPPSFDLVVATLGRIDELARFLDSVTAQNYPSVRAIVVDQNDDARLDTLVGGRSFPVERIRSGEGLSRARNAALALVEADLVAFPDDDCVYPPGALARVAARFADETSLDGLTGRAEDESGRSSGSWQADPATLTDDNLWNRAISFTIFLRRETVERVGAFDERLGLGSPEPWSSGEEIDYLIRAVRAGAHIKYDPSVVIHHEVRPDSAAIGLRDGSSVGYLLRKHGYGARTVGRMLVRPLGGIAVSAAHRDRGRAAYHWSTVRGRVRGYFGASDSNSSA
jgi:GT2 family glycosyltransferase